MSQSDPLTQEWFAVPNDLIGGWCVVPARPDPPSTQSEHQFLVADFCNEKTARHIAHLHNRWLAKQAQMYPTMIYPTRSEDA